MPLAISNSNGYFSIYKGPSGVEATKTKRATIFSVSCSYLNRSVVLYEDTWKYKICAAHNEVRNCLSFIKQTLSGTGKDVFVYGKKRDPKKLALYVDCPNLHNMYKYIKIAIETVSGTEAVMTTSHGLNDLPGEDMERVNL